MNKRRQRFLLALSLAAAGLLSAAVVPDSELEANKPQVGHTKDGTDFILDWETQPEVYYFVEGSPDLVNWLPAKLLKDNAESGSLSLGTAINLSKAFYRLSLVGDPGSARLRADDDGDGIINLLEVEAGWDAFEAPVSVDSEPDGLPDYWEQFYFGTLEHDGSYIAVEGGLTLAEAFAAGTDPREVDSDGDGWTDAQELAWGWNPNYNQSRDDDRYSATGDFNNDGISNATAVLNGHAPNAGEPTGLDQPPRYAVIDVGANRSAMQVSNAGHVWSRGTLAGDREDRVWFWGQESEAHSNFTGRSVGDDGTLYGDSVGPVYSPGLILPDSAVANPSGYYGFLIPSFQAIGSANPVALEAASGLVDGTYSYPYFSSNRLIAASPSGNFVAGNACNLVVYGEQNYYYAQFLYHAELSEGAMVSLEKFGERVFEPSPGNPSGPSFAFVSVNDAGDIVYRHQNHLNETIYALNDTVLSVDSIFDLTPDGLVLAATGGNIVLTDGSTDQVLFAGENALDYAVSEGRSRVLSETVFYLQNLDETTGDPVPLAGGDAFTLYSIDDLHDSDSGWNDLTPVSMSDDGSFIAANAVKDGVKHALLLLKVELDPVYGDGPDGIGYCPNSIADGNVSCEFVGADYEDLNINSPINQIPNPAAIVIESSANDGNVAVFRIKTDLDDAEAEKVFHWVIEPDGNGGGASFYPPNDNDNYKGKEVKISGSSSGRVKIKVYAGEPNPNTEPAVFTEALVVHKKLLPYRANIVTYEGNTNQVLPSSPTDIQNSMNVANVILRQAGIELVQSTNTDDGDMTYVHSPLPGENGEVIEYWGNAFFVKANNQNLVEQVGGLEAIKVLAVNYLPDLLQINFIESFKQEDPNEWTMGRNTCRPQSDHEGSSLSAAYKTSDKDDDDESLEHTLSLFADYEPSEYPATGLPFQNLYGVGVSWSGVSQSQRTAGYVIAHEVLHAMNLRHRKGVVTENLDGLEDKYRGPAGTNIMDYGGGIDLDLLQALIARGSPLLQ